MEIKRSPPTVPFASGTPPDRRAPVSISDAEASSGEGSFSYWTPNGSVTFPRTWPGESTQSDRDSRGPHPMLVGDHGRLDEDSSTDIRLPDEPYRMSYPDVASSASVDAVYAETRTDQYESAHRFAARHTSILLVTSMPLR